MSDINRIKERINFCIQGALWEQLPRFLNELHPADIAEIINHAPIGDQNTLFDLIDQDMKPDVPPHSITKPKLTYSKNSPTKKFLTSSKKWHPMMQPTFSVTRGRST